MPLRNKKRLSLELSGDGDGDGGGADGTGSAGGSRSERGGGVREDSFRVTDNTFRRGELVLHSGAAEGSRPRSKLRPDDLQQVRILGRGNGGIVKLARHREDHTKQYAVKVVYGLLHNQSHRKQIAQEVQALHKIDCDCLVRMHGAFFVQENAEVVLEFMDLGSLADVVAARLGGRREPRQRMPPRAIAGIAYQILWGLAYLKFEKMMHRDIKPQNVLLNARGEVKLTDFGIAKILDNSQAMAQTFAGTFKYMSPERIRNESYNASCDIWSLGLLLVELATGRFPYGASTTHIELVEHVLNDPVPALDPEDGFPAGLCEMVSHCLQKKPEDRLPAEILLGAPWMGEEMEVTDVASAVGAVRHWLDDTAAASEGAGAGAAAGAHADADVDWEAMLKSPSAARAAGAKALDPLNGSGRSVNSYADDGFESYDEADDPDDDLARQRK